MGALRHAHIAGIVEVAVVGVVTDELNMGAQNLCLVARSIVKGPEIVVDQTFAAAFGRNTGLGSV